MMPVIQTGQTFMRGIIHNAPVRQVYTKKWDKFLRKLLVGYTFCVSYFGEKMKMILLSVRQIAVNPST
ncbi:hypothetical protein AA106_16275 [Photorhabdus laumondii subsp. laumondii]|nr:hypothetical protein A4R40_03600 [Photorhabdus laumondii subsp. laumondii]KTL59650.1 hypothetical protein AA106_16275 [Photorhabdus laumondii subsp. laumondii]RAW65274.1 hypothetical protein CKY15_21980 [Photorhabdus sp. S7-51]RAW71864.1 hypothetical protein CKY06_22060 [Photorhabdus sp. S15-56]